MRNKDAGFIFRIHRKEKNVTIAELSSKTGIAESKLSDFENGKRTLPPLLITELYLELGIQFKINENAHSLMNKTMKEICDLIVYGQDYEEIYQKHLNMKEEVQCSSAYITYWLVVFIYHIYQQDEFFDYKRYVTLLMDHIDCLDSGHQQILYDTVGVYYKNIHEFDKAMDCFNKGMKNGGLTVSTAMILYHMAGVFALQGYSFEALQCLQNAKRKFDQELIFDRSLMCSVEIATILARLGSYAEAENQYLKCIIAAKNAHWSKKRLSVLYNNLLWHYLLDGEYQQIIKQEKEAMEVDPKCPDICSNIAYAYWRMGDLKNAKKIISIAKKNIAYSFENGASFVDALNAIITKKPIMTIEKKLIKMAKQSEKRYDSQMQMLAYNLLIEMSIEQKESQKELEYKTKFIQTISETYKNRK